MKDLRTVLLGLLRQGELYGYQIKRALERDEFKEWVMVPTASLYHELEEMTDDGLVESSGEELTQDRPARRLYRLSLKGSEELTRLLREAWSSIGRAGAPEDIAALFMDALPKEEIARALSERFAHLNEELERVESTTRERAADPLLQEAVSAVWEHTRLRLQSEIEWTRDLITRVEAGEYSLAQAAKEQQAARPARQPHRLTEGLGAFTFVLHTHLPYSRMAGRWPHGEEWIHEALAETYIPLLNALYDLRDEGVHYKLTLSLTPILAEQLADADVREHFMIYLDEEIKASKADIPRFGETDDRHAEYLATFYRDYYTHIRETYLDRFGGDVVGALRLLQDEGYVEIVTCAATHGYLPLLSRDSSIYGQLRTGIESYERHFARAPRGIWLPECAYRPAYVGEDGTIRPGLEEFLSALDLGHFFAETHAIEGGRPVGKAAGDVAIGPYTAIKRRYVIPVAEGEHTAGTTYEAYYVVGSDKGLTNPPVAVMGRNNRTGQQVWSGDWGYPGDADYREFHKKDHESGLQYWRVTGPQTDLGAKDWYHPDWAQHKVGAHARHFASLVEELTTEYYKNTRRYGIIASNYDTELFGHWWFEGIDWLREVLRLLSNSEVVDLTTAGEYVARHEPEQVMAVPESSWGVGGTHWTWDNPETWWMWEPIHEAEKRMEQMVDWHPQAQGDLLLVLNQAARELLLAESSDWPFLVTTGQAKQYAIGRFRSHLDRFYRLIEMAEQGLDGNSAAYARQLYELDKVFPTIDYHWFRSRQGKAD